TLQYSLARKTSQNSLPARQPRSLWVGMGRGYGNIAGGGVERSVPVARQTLRQQRIATETGRGRIGHLVGSGRAGEGPSRQRLSFCRPGGGRVFDRVLAEGLARRRGAWEIRASESWTVAAPAPAAPARRGLTCRLVRRRASGSEMPFMTTTWPCPVC